MTQRMQTRGGISIQRNQIDPSIFVAHFIRRAIHHTYGIGRELCHTLTTRLIAINAHNINLARLAFATKRLGVLFRIFQELLVIGTRNAQVNIIVPRNEATMANGAQKRAAQQVIAKAQLLENRVDALQQIELDQLQSAQRRAFRGTAGRNRMRFIRLARATFLAGNLRRRERRGCASGCGRSAFARKIFACVRYRSIKRGHSLLLLL